MTMDNETAKQFDKLNEIFKEFNETLPERKQIAEELISKDPNLAELSAFIIAGDIQSARRAERMLAEGIPYKKAVVFVGSYGRLEFALKAHQSGYLSLNELLDDLPDLWRGSDPDDTDPRFLALWLQAWERNKRQTILDGNPLPDKKTLTIYRGQDQDAIAGIAWSLNKKIADKFAHGAATRQMNRNGVIYKARVRREDIIAYLTLRHEEEVIVSPMRVKS